jgi:predicted nuclease of predicted toxin-antitoxin system
MKFKLDENLSPSLAALFASQGHDAHSIIEQSLSGKPDALVIEVCRTESRCLVTFDLDFANIHAYPPSSNQGIVALRLTNQSHASAEAAVQRILPLLKSEPLAGSLWIVEDHRVRIHS